MIGRAFTRESLRKSISKVLPITSENPKYLGTVISDMIGELQKINIEQGHLLVIPSSVEISWGTGYGNKVAIAKVSYEEARE